MDSTKSYNLTQMLSSKNCENSVKRNSAIFFLNEEVVPLAYLASTIWHATSQGSSYLLELHQILFEIDFECHVF